MDYSKLLSSVLDEMGMDHLPDDTEINNMTEEQKQNLYEKQIMILTNFREKSIELLSKLQKELAELNSIPITHNKNSLMAAPQKQRSSTPIITKIRSQQKLIQCTPKRDNSVGSLHKAQGMMQKSSSHSVFDPTSLNTINRKQRRPLFEEKVPEKKIRFETLDERPRWI